MVSHVVSLRWLKKAVGGSGETDAVKQLPRTSEQQMYPLQVKTRGSSSSSGNSIDGRRTPILSEHLDDLTPLSPQSWVQKIGSAMFQKIKIAPSTETPVVVVSATTTPKKMQFALDLAPVETRIAMPADDDDDRRDKLSATTRSNSLGQQSIEFIKVYCSPKRGGGGVPSPKIKPLPPDTRRKPPPRGTRYDRDDDGDLVEVDMDDEQRPTAEDSPTKQQLVRPPRDDVVPVLQSFFSKPKTTHDKGAHRRKSVHSVDNHIRRQEQYKRDLARQDELRAAAAAAATTNNNPDADDAAACRREVLRTHARSLKRQRMADVAAAKRVLQERRAHDLQCYDAARREWEGAFEDEVTILAAAFAKARHRIDDDDARPRTTAGLVVPEAQSHVARDVAMLPFQLRAQTAPHQDVVAVRSKTRHHQIVAAVEEQSRPPTSEASLDEYLGVTEPQDDLAPATTLDDDNE
ncbi:Aste57867_23192 [Aphanomyces stellatus]|uniref:Aste57867_23192 protein n=1 Tax=Aphanomyces stellatus TaxID=120398 RepID=A0A485LMA5_9STRA|nr:hypothetical protein As57867_023121 [Aphanomyces stellatus]VFT99839.1 Aste57867_23192 [Aphanomyces stellatus]